MENNQLISIQTFCTYYEVEFDFVESLREHDLIEVVEERQERFLQVQQLQRIERLVRLHRDLDINVAGIGAIDNLLDKVGVLQREIQFLQNRLRRYETDI